jgi:hypothetical protein
MSVRVVLILLGILLLGLQPGAEGYEILSLW